MISRFQFSRLSDKGTYDELLFYPETLVKESRSQAWISLFYPEFRRFDFRVISHVPHSLFKKAFLSGFGFGTECFGAMIENG